MRLTKVLSRKVDDKTYYKYVITLPPEVVKKSGIKGGNDLKVSVRKGKITISPDDK